MQNLFGYIEEKRSALARHSFFAFVSDTKIAARERFGFASYIAPFVLGARDLFSFILPDQNSQDPLQQRVNRHCLEERGHAELYLADLRILSTSDDHEPSGSLEVLWGHKTLHTRRMLLGLVSLASQADSKLRILMLESLEAAQRTSFENWRGAAIELQNSTGRQLCYFLGEHEQFEEEHDLYQTNTRAELLEIRVTPEEARLSRAAIDRIFSMFSAMFDEWLTNARTRAA